MKKIICYLLVLLLCLLLSGPVGCTGPDDKTAETPESGTPAPETTDAPVSEAPAVTEAPPEETAEPDWPHALDRNGVDTSGFADPDAEGAKVVSPEEFSAAPAANEVKVYRAELIDGAQSSSDRYSFTFGELPRFDPDKEGGYRFNGSSVSFTMHFESDLGHEDVSCRNVTDESDHTYVIKTVAQRDYAPLESALPEPIMMRLAICIDNDNGIRDGFIIDKEYYLLHFIGEFTGRDLDPSTITERSVEPLSEVQLLHLTAMALHYVHGEREYSSDVFKLFRYYETDGALAPTLQNAFAHARLELTRGDKTAVIESFDEFEQLMMIFYRDIEERFTFDTEWEGGPSDLSSEDRIDIRLISTDDQAAAAGGIISGITVLASGKMVVEPGEMSCPISIGDPYSMIMNRAELTFSPTKTYPFNEIASFFD